MSPERAPGSQDTRCTRGKCRDYVMTSHRAYTFLAPVRYGGRPRHGINSRGRSPSRLARMRISLRPDSFPLPSPRSPPHNLYQLIPRSPPDFARSTTQFRTAIPLPWGEELTSPQRLKQSDSVKKGQPFDATVLIR